MLLLWLGLKLNGLAWNTWFGCYKDSRKYPEGLPFNKNLVLSPLTRLEVAWLVGLWQTWIHLWFAEIITAVIISWQLASLIMVQTKWQTFRKLGRCDFYINKDIHVRRQRNKGWAPLKGKCQNVFWVGGGSHSGDSSCRAPQHISSIEVT